MLTKTNLFLLSSCYLFNRNQKEQQFGFITKSGFPLMAKSVQASWRSQTTSLGSCFLGKEEGVLLEDRRSRIRTGLPLFTSTKSQSGFRIANAQKWWKKGLQPNMTEMTSAQELVDSIANAGDKLVVVAFFSPGCGGCRALHPKLCQLAEMNPEVQFLHVNYEEQKLMCYSLNVHVLPFFRFYRGVHGRLCSFSCTSATVNAVVSVLLCLLWLFK